MLNTFLYHQKNYFDELKIINGIRFTAREVDVIACILTGRNDKDIAFLLDIKPDTVEKHLEHIREKAAVSSSNSMIGLVEKSGKVSLFRNHYQNLLLENEFNQALKKIAALTKDKSLSCLIIYRGIRLELDSCIRVLKVYLERLGIKTIYSPPIKEQISTNYSFNYFICILDQFLLDNPKRINELSPHLLLKHIPTIFLILEGTNIPETLEAKDYLDFRKTEDYNGP